MKEREEREEWVGKRRVKGRKKGEIVKEKERKKGRKKNDTERKKSKEKELTVK